MTILKTNWERKKERKKKKIYERRLTGIECIMGLNMTYMDFWEFDLHFFFLPFLIFDSPEFYV